AARAAPSGLPPVPGAPRSGPRLRLPAARRLRRTTGTLCHRRRIATIGGERTRHRTQRHEGLGALAPPVSEVPAANLCRVGSRSDPACLLGAGVVPTATRQGESAAGRRARSGMQVDPYPLSVLAGLYPV